LPPIPLLDENETVKRYIFNHNNDQSISVIMMESGIAPFNSQFTSTTFKVVCERKLKRLEGRARV
jgi:hypothetical protein